MNIKRPVWILLCRALSIARFNDDRLVRIVMGNDTVYRHVVTYIGVWSLCHGDLLTRGGLYSDRRLLRQVLSLDVTGHFFCAASSLFEGNLSRTELLSLDLISSFDVTDLFSPIPLTPTHANRDAKLQSRSPMRECASAEFT